MTQNPTLLSRIRHAVLGVSDAEATAFSRGTGPNWTHLQTAVRHAVGGYHTVLDSSRLADLVPRLQSVDLPWQGYAFEGAAMGLTGLDCFLPSRRSRFQAYVSGPADDHAYMAHIGAGEALARLRRRPEPFLRRLPDPVLRWLVMDGYGFHEGFFKPDRHIIGQRIPEHLSPVARRIFDQGVGRSIWFITGADAADIRAAIAAFPAARHHDLWLGVGVACGYVGGADVATIQQLKDLAGTHAPRLAIGTAFVAKGRLRAKNLIPDTDLASRILCDRSATDAARLVDAAFAAVRGARTDCAYDLLQQRLDALLAEPATVSALSTGLTEGAPR